jgi:hypothetical protein
VTILCTLFTFLFINVVHADEKHIGEIALLGGIARLNNGGGSQFIYGVEGDYFFDPNWSIGILSDTVNPNSVSVAGVSYSQSLSNLDFAVKFTWNQLTLGILAGVGTTETTVPGGSSSSNLNYGLVGAYDYLLSNKFSLGPQLDVLWTTLTNGYTEIDFLVTAKYWF